MEPTGKLKQIYDLLSAMGELEPRLKACADGAATAIRNGGFVRNAWLIAAYFGTDVPKTIDDGIAALKSVVYPLARARV